MKRFLIFAILLVLIVVFAGPALSVEQKGTSAKIPYPMGVENITLQRQKVDITVYSNFIKVEGEYLVRNENRQEVTATFGFPFYRHSEMDRGEFPPMGLQVLQRKKDQDYFVRRTLEGDPSNGAFKEWYLWEVDIAPGRNGFFRVEYYLRLSRDQGIPFFSYGQSQSRAYAGSIIQTDIDVNMGIDCRDLPMVAQPDFSGRNYLYASLPSPRIQRNILSWSFKNHLPLEDLSIYFYRDGYPDWLVESSDTEPGMASSAQNVFDGDIRTSWVSPPENKGVGSYLVFTPVIRDNKSNTRPFEPVVREIGLVPGNTATLSSFYNYSHLMEGIVEVLIIKPEIPEEDREKLEEIIRDRSDKKKKEKKKKD